MKVILYFLIALIIYPICQITAQQKDISGIWTGKLALPNSIELAIVFNLSKDDAGIYSSTLDSSRSGSDGNSN